MTEFIKYINQITPQTEEAKSDLVNSFKYRTFKKGQFINEEGQICKQLYFIDTGLVKHYYNYKNRIFILRFFPENNIFTVLDSFINQEPASFMTIALEETSTTYIDHNDLELLSSKYHSIETFIRKTYEMSSVVNLKRIKELFESNATELYKSFIIENKHLLQRISLGDIASYLGISQVSLSRIRRKR